MNYSLHISRTNQFSHTNHLFNKMIEDLTIGGNGYDVFFL